MMFIYAFALLSCARCVLSSTLTQAPHPRATLVLPRAISDDATDFEGIDLAGIGQLLSLDPTASVGSSECASTACKAGR